MGATPYPGGVTFRVWAPHARDVSVRGTFPAGSVALGSEAGGCWSADVDGASVGDRYRYHINGELSRNDPYAREVTNSAGDSVVTNPDFDWGTVPFSTPQWHELVIYELHVGTFNDRPGGAPGGFDSVVARLDYLRDLGINAIELMPSAEFAFDFSWGYNPSHIFAIEQAYGGPRHLKELVKAAHEHGIAVIFDVVYNHFGPGDLDLWQFDGWSENGKGGIYFYNDGRSQTPWGDTRPDYGRPEVRRFILDNVRYWLEEFRFDGLRWDATGYIRNRYGTNDPANDIPAGWLLMQEVNRYVDEHQPWKLQVAEDLQNNAWLVRPVGAGGAGFDTQWDPEFVHPVRATLTTVADGGRSMAALRGAITHRYDGAALTRVIYTESHDEVANGQTRLPEAIWPGNAGSWPSRKRSTLGATMVYTAPGIPMIFAGQEILEDEWFHDDDPIDWTKADTYAGILQMYRDLIALRRNRAGTTRGLTGQHVSVFHLNDDDNVVAFLRWDRGGPRDDVVVVLNVANRSYDNYRIGLPRAGRWRLRFNSDWSGYSADFGAIDAYDVTAATEPLDGLPCSGTVAIGPYTALVYSQD